MAVEDLQKIINSDTLAEGKVKINSAIDRINAGEFNNVFIHQDLDVLGELRVTRLVEIEAESQSIGDPILTLSDVDLVSDDNKARGIVYKYFSDGEEKFGFFGRVQGEENFSYIPEANVNNEQVSGTIGTINAKIDGSNVINVDGLTENLNDVYVHVSSDQNIQGTKTIQGFLQLDNPNQGESSNHALPASRKLVGGDGIKIDGFQGTGVQLTEDRTLDLDSTVIRTSGDQQILGTLEVDSLISSDAKINDVDFENFIIKDKEQDIYSTKVFRPTDGNDGIKPFGREGGNSNYFVSLETNQLTDNRKVTLANSDTQLTPGTMMNIDNNQTVSGIKTFVEDILFTDSGIEKRGIEGLIGGADHWFIGGGAFGPDSGYVELASGKNADEPIFVRQYSGSPRTGSIDTEMVLLSSDGNSFFPGTLDLGSPTTKTTQAVRADRQITAGQGLQGGGNLSQNISFAVDNTVLRTTGDFTLQGNITFDNTISGVIEEAEKLASPVEINGIPFDGTQDIQITTAPASGGDGDQVFFENDIIVSNNYTITQNRNAMSAGPIEILEGVTVTIPDGSTWTVV